MLKISFFFILCEIIWCQKVPISADIHDFMTNEELVHYFKTTNKSELPEYEVIYLPRNVDGDDLVNEVYSKFHDGNRELLYEFSAFKRPIKLKLQKNEDILSPAFKAYFHDVEGEHILAKSSSNCHYIHKDEHFVAAFSLCSPNFSQGLILLDNTTLELQPLFDELHQKISKRSIRENQPYLIKKVNFKRSGIYNDFLFPPEDIPNAEFFDIFDDHWASRKSKQLTLEVALFFDEAAYRIFAPYFNYNDGELRHMLLAYLNGVQALYHHPSLGRSLNIVLVRLDIMKRQPRALPHYDGERGKLLDSFCLYQAGLKPAGDSNPEHWDMGLYVSGLDFHAYENGRKNGATMGLATVSGVCLDKYACVIAEFGTTNVFGKPYPSAGFTSVYILAHEIGHNLGMHHDSTSNRCPKEGYIMSPSRGTNGETQWSTCSAEIMANLGWAKCLQDSSNHAPSKDHTRFSNSPGQHYTAKKQCEILLRDRDATVFTATQQLSSICYSLQCKTPHRSGYYFAGPALDGTKCGNGKYCYGGDCVNKLPPKPVTAIEGGWSDWRNGTCSSGCIEKSQGIVKSKRECNNPVPVNTDQGCDGSRVKFDLCRDSKICGKKRPSAVDYASRKCKEFSKMIKDLDPKGVGLQAPHEEARLWSGCAIFCKRADSKAFYTPRVELNDLKVSPYFPDGTWCHMNNNGKNYYCMQHHCLSEDFKFGKHPPLHLDDLPFSQNARPWPVPVFIKNYFTLNEKGRPILTSFKNAPIYFLDDHQEWEDDKDYVELPNIEERFQVLNHEVDSVDFF